MKIELAPVESADTGPRIETIAHQKTYIGLWVCTAEGKTFWEIDVNAIEGGAHWLEDGPTRGPLIERYYRSDLAEALALYNERVLHYSQLSPDETA